MSDTMIEYVESVLVDIHEQHVNQLLEYYLLHGKPMNDHEPDHR